MNRSETIAACLVLLLLGAVQACAENLTPPTEDLLAGPDAGPWRRLFLDATVVEEQESLRRVFHAAQKCDANPVIRAERPWEAGTPFGGPYIYGTVLWDEGRLRMWYHCQVAGVYLNPYAESSDGIHWTRPDLGIVDFDGSKKNNLVLGMNPDPSEQSPFRSNGQCHNPCVIKRPWETDPAKRYALFCFGQEYHKARVAYSPDGLHWTFVPETAKQALFATNDVVSFFYDPYKKRYVATCKMVDRRGRAVDVAWSDDGRKWTKPVDGPVFSADNLDPDATQVYGMPVFPYQGLYIGLPWIYNARWLKHGEYTDQRMYEAESDSPCTMDAQLAWSWNMIQWNRPPERRPAIVRGQAGEFDSHQIYTARAPIQAGDQIYLYYGGWNAAHNAIKAQSAIGLAIWRLDGFCSMKADANEGWLRSRRELLAKPEILINAKTGPQGYVAAEILDCQDRPIPGFTREQCAPFTGDSVRHVLRWKTAHFGTEHASGEKKIRFYLKDAALFSYLPR